MRQIYKVRILLCLGHMDGQHARRLVLVVDDDELVRHVLAELLARGGYSVLEAVDGQDAWRQLRECCPSLIVTDLQMPRCDGRELCRRVRMDPRTHDIPVLIVTGSPESVGREVACDGVYAKPIALSDFMSDIARVIDHGREPKATTVIATAHHPSM